MKFLSAALPSLVEAKFASAKASGALIFSDTELSIVRTSKGIPLQLRYCPALARKPKSNPDTKSKKINPFETPSPELLVDGIPQQDPSHNIVLNKFPVIEDHIILATRTYKKQTDLLEEDDIYLSYQCLREWQKADDGRSGRQLFAFFNSGKHSGASQPHRHIQFLPVEKMQGDVPQTDWSALTDMVASSSDSVRNDSTQFLSHPKIPFAHFVSRLSPMDASPKQLHDMYLQLYEIAEATVQSFIDDNPGSEDLLDASSGSGRISYNLSMTASAMAICPRRAEGLSILNPNEGQSGYVALNGTLLAGTLMVKSAEEWDLLRSSASPLDSILEAIGIPRKISGHL